MSANSFTRFALVIGRTKVNGTGRRDLSAVFRLRSQKYTRRTHCISTLVALMGHSVLLLGEEISVGGLYTRAIGTRGDCGDVNKP